MAWSDSQLPSPNLQDQLSIRAPVAGLYSELEQSKPNLINAIILHLLMLIVLVNSGNEGFSYLKISLHASP